MAATKIASHPSAQARRLKAIEAVTVMGMTHKEASEYSGLAPGTISQLLAKPEIKEYIGKIQKQEEKKFKITREQVLEGFMEAIQDAKLLSEPATQIRGWEQIAKMEGFYAPERREVDLPEDTKEMIRSLQDLDTETLAKIAGQDNMIDLNENDFQRIEPSGP